MLNDALYMCLSLYEEVKTCCFIKSHTLINSAGLTQVPYLHKYKPHLTFKNKLKIYNISFISCIKIFKLTASQVPVVAHQVTTTKTRETETDWKEDAVCTNSCSWSSRQGWCFSECGICLPLLTQTMIFTCADFIHCTHNKMSMRESETERKSWNSFPMQTTIFARI